MKKIAIIIQNLNGGGAERTAANPIPYFSESMKYILLFLMVESLASTRWECFKGIEGLLLQEQSTKSN